MLIATLNHNLPNLTDNLVSQLKRDPYFEKCELMVVDNGSSDSPAESTTHRLEQNVFFGGGLNLVLEYFLESSHEHLYFLNNDLVFHGPSFLRTSLDEATKSNASVYSPSIINASIEQCLWKQMWNWGVGLRQVRWIDFQAPLLRKDICTIINQYPSELIYGWGNDFFTGCIGEDHNLITIVSDTNTICHLNSQTFKQNKINIGINEFCRNAEANMNKFFAASVYREKFLELREYGINYKSY